MYKSIRDGVSTIQMYSSTSMITLNMHEYEYEYSENKCTRVRLLYNILEYDYFGNVLEYEYEYDYFPSYSSTSTSTQKVLVLEYKYTSTITPSLKSIYPY